MTLTPERTEQIGQRIVMVSAIAQFIIFGVRLSFPVFFAEFIRAEHWSSEVGASIFSASMIMFAIGSIPGGMLLDRFGPRIVFSAGTILLAIGLFLSGTTHTVEQLVITYGVIGGAGLSLIGLGPTAATISIWVSPSRRARSIGIAFAGTGLGSLIFVPLSTFLIAHFGWRSSYIILSLMMIGIVTPLMAVGMVRHPSQNRRNTSSHTSSQPDTHINWRYYALSPTFWVLMILAFTTMGPVRSLTVHQIAYMESVNITRETASAIVGMAGFLTVLTFTGWGFVSDRFGRLWAFIPGAIALMGAVFALYLMKSSDSTLLLIGYSILLALGEGSRSSQVTALSGDLYGGYGLGMVNGWLGSMFGLGAAFGPWIVGRLKDMTATYYTGFVVIIILTLISLVAFIWNSRRVQHGNDP